MFTINWSLYFVLQDDSRSHPSKEGLNVLDIHFGMIIVRNCLDVLYIQLCSCFKFIIVPVSVITHMFLYV